MLSKAGSIQLGESGFQVFASLRSIIITNGSFELIEPNWFSENNKVEHIEMTWNWFRRLKPKYFSTLKNIRILNFSGNDIYTIEVGTFTDNPNLEVLDVSDNWLDSIIDIGYLPRLRHFDFSNNEIIDVSFQILTASCSVM